MRQQTKIYPETVLCKVMEVNRSEYYSYLKTNDLNKIHADFELISKGKEIHHLANDKYGTR